MDEALDQIGRLDKAVQHRIFKFFDRLKAHANPRDLGEALSGPLAGLWKYRLGIIDLSASWGSEGW